MHSKHPSLKQILLCTLSLFFLSLSAPAQGQVTTPAEPAYPDTLGDLAFQKLQLNMGRLTSNQTKTWRIGLKHVGQKPLRIDSITSKHLPIQGDLAQQELPTELAPGETAELVVSFDGSLGDQAGWGRYFGQRDALVLHTADKMLAQKMLTVSWNYERIYTEEEIENGPRLTFEQDEWNAGEIIQGETISHSFWFTNTGESDLRITKTKASCGCTAIEPTQKVIKPGERSKIEVRFNSTGKRGRQHKTVTVWSNDLESEIRTLHLRVNVLEDPFSQPAN